MSPIPRSFESGFLDLRTLILVLLFLIVIFWVVAVSQYRPIIENDLKLRTEAALEQADEFRDVEVRFLGRDAILSGHVPNAAAKIRAEQRTAETLGVRKVIENRLVDESAPSPEAMIGGATARNALESLQDKPHIRVVVHDNQILLAGKVATQDIKSTILNRLSTLYPDLEILAQIEIKESIGESAWDLHLLGQLTQLPDFKPIALLAQGREGSEVTFKVDTELEMNRIQQICDEHLPFLVKINYLGPGGSVESFVTSETGRLLTETVIYFDNGQQTIDGDDENTLQQIVAALNDFPTLKIRLEGHSDSSGAPAVNLQLSQLRAKSVRDFLLQNGISADRLQVTGLGDRQPNGDNATEEGRGGNRRVEIRVESVAMGL